MAVVEAVAEAVGPIVGLMIEIHGRLGAGDAVRFIRRSNAHHIVWCEEPVAPESIELLARGQASARPADLLRRAALRRSPISPG